MGYGALLYKKYAPIRAVVKFQNSVFYPIIFALLCAVSGVSSKTVYVPILLFMCALVTFSALFGNDNKVFLVPILMAYYALGNDTDKLYSSERGDIISTFDIDGLASAILCGVVMAVAIFARLIADGTIKRALTKRGICFWSILTLDAAFILNGAFSGKWVASNLLYGLLTSLAITVFYFLVLSMIENSQEPEVYACKTLVCTSLAAVAQATVKGYRLHLAQKLFIEDWKGDVFQFARIELPWGIATIIGTVICLGIPAALWLAIFRKYCFVSYFSALVLVAGTFLLNTRVAMLLGAAMLVLGTILGCFCGKNKKTFRFTALSLAVLAIIAMLFMDKYMHTLDPIIELAKKLLRFNDLSSVKSRLELWKNGMDDYLSSWLFGVGFRDGATESAQNIYSAMYHSIIIQFLGAMGTFGIIAFFVHIKHVAEIFIRRFDIGRAIIICVPFMIITASFVDNYFFYPNFQIIYAVFLAVAEHMLEESRKKRLLSHSKVEADRKPRVVFTYVEAGKGHIIPEEAVCESFKEKYGDEYEVVESYFYSDTEDEKLQKTERLFASAVKKQNKSRVLSWLCRTGNWVCGDRFALYFLLTFTFSGMQSKRRARKVLLGLDADVIFTTHWSTAFYASELERPPYVIMLCPDAYSNGMFNVDVNDLLIPSESGKRDAEKIRMYGGGNVVSTAFPIRNEAKALYGRKKEIRRELGIGESEFVVTMSDGGYGLANMEATVSELLKRDARLTVIALCGTNKVLYERLSAIKDTENIKLIPISFTKDVLKYIVAADLFCGKSGANSMAEPAYFGVPIIVTRSITYIERKIKKYYVRELGGTMNIPSPKLAARKIVYFSEHRQELDKYSKALDSVKGKCGTDDISELLYDRIKTRVYK